MSKDDSIIQQIEQMRSNMLILAIIAVWYAEKYLDKKPYRDLTLPSHDYVQELLNGHPK